jgi:hypothetical protein
MNLQVLIEAIAVGIANVIFGTVAGILVGPFFKIDLPIECKDWNKFFVMEISLFLTGVLIHFCFEIFGVNKWYCKNGSACKIPEVLQVAES